MANFNLDPVAQTEFDALVKAKYRSEGFRLRGFSRMRENVMGKEIQFRLMGDVTAEPTGYAQQVVSQNPGVEPKTASIVKHTCPILVDEVEELTENFDAKMESVQRISEALGRRSDQILINAIKSVTYNATPSDSQGTFIDDNATGFTYDKYTQIIEAFEDRAVPMPDRCVAVTARQFQQLMNEDQFVNSRYTSNNAVDRGMINEFLGANFVIMPSMSEGGLPNGAGGASEDRAFAWHKNALGMGIGASFRVEINYLPDFVSHLANGIFSAGATPIDPRGFIAIDTVKSP